MFNFDDYETDYYINDLNKAYNEGYDDGYGDAYITYSLIISRLRMVINDKNIEIERLKTKLNDNEQLRR